jgi:hypothetical protein
VLYFFGQLQAAETLKVQGMKNAYKDAGYNFILFNANPVAYSYMNLDAWANKIADSLVEAFNNGMDAMKFEIVGYGIGAHFAGSVGSKIKSKSKGIFIVPRIIALNPSRFSTRTLTRNDADFVMTIHTDDFFGDSSVIGDVAFFINGGRNQPMCKFLFLLDDVFCSEKQVQVFWIEAVEKQSEVAFPARKSYTYQEFMDREYDTSVPIAYMNLKTQKTISGKYFLNTHDTSPYSKDAAEP